MKILDDMRAVLAVHKCGSMTAAAVELGTNPATVSRQIARVGETLGVAPFIRSDRDWRLNPQLHTLVEIFEDFDGRMATELALLKRHDQSETHVVKVGAPPSVNAHLLVPSLVDLTRLHPNISLVLEGRVLETGLGASDVVVSFFPPGAGRLKLRRCGVCQYAAYARQGWTPDDGWVGLIDRFGGMASEGARAFFAGEPRLKVDGFVQVRDCILQLGLAGILPTYAATDHADLQPITPGPSVPPYPLFVFHHDSRTRDPAVRAVVDWICDVLKKI